MKPRILKRITAMTLFTALAIRVGLAAQEQQGAPTFTVLHAFAGEPTGHIRAQVCWVLDGAGNLCGTTNGGGDTSCNAPYGCGLTHVERSTQLVFSHFSTSDPERFNAYDDVRSKLVSAGGPVNEIA